MTAAELAKGPDSGSGPAAGSWTIVGAKTEGVQPGLTVRDTAGQIYFVKFDPPSNPEMASGAEVISTKLFHAAGYHVPENYLATIHPDALIIGDRAEVVEDGKHRAMRRWDLDAVLAKSARNADGSYRVLASKALDGTPVGPFRYFGTRPDDPNDIFPHEHRRELRGLGVLAAWLNHDDSRAPNTLDTLVPARRPHGGAPSPDRLRLHPRQRQHPLAVEAGRQRIPVGVAAGDRHDAHARVLRAAVDQGRVSGPAVGGALRKQLLPARNLEADLRQSRIRQCAPGRPLLGCPAGRRHQRRGDPHHRRHRPVLRPASHRVHDRHDPRPPAEGPHQLARRAEPDRRSRAGRERPTDRSQRRRTGGRAALRHTATPSSGQCSTTPPMRTKPQPPKTLPDRPCVFRRRCWRAGPSSSRRGSARSIPTIRPGPSRSRSSSAAPGAGGSWSASRGADLRGSGFKVQGSGFGSGFKVQGSVQGFKSRSEFRRMRSTCCTDYSRYGRR